MYMTTRRAYPTAQELTVDYGKAYARNYASGDHRPSCPQLYTIPPEKLTAEQTKNPSFPRLPGWFNPTRQPARRPAFAPRRGKAGAIDVCRDEPAVVAARP